MLPAYGYSLFRAKVLALTWSSFCDLLCTRFGRDRHQALIRQFYSIRQTSSVSEYAERFEVLMNHLMSYSDAVHPLYFLTKFIEGLRGDIRAAVMVQRPADLDTAVSLATLHEEVTDGLYSERAHSGQQSVSKWQNPFQYPSVVPMPLPPPPTPVPPQRHASLIKTPAAEDRRGTEGARASDSATKVSALKAYSALVACALSVVNAGVMNMCAHR